MNTICVSLILPSCDREIEYFKTKHYFNSKNIRFLNKHVDYLRSFTQWRKKKRQKFDGSEHLATTASQQKCRNSMHHAFSMWIMWCLTIDRSRDLASTIDFFPNSESGRLIRDILQENLQSWSRRFSYIVDFAKKTFRRVNHFIFMSSFLFQAFYFISKNARAWKNIYQHRNLSLMYLEKSNPYIWTLLLMEILESKEQVRERDSNINKSKFDSFKIHFLFICYLFIIELNREKFMSRPTKESIETSTIWSYVIALVVFF